MKDMSRRHILFYFQPPTDPPHIFFALGGLLFELFHKFVPFQQRIFKQVVP